MVFTLHRYIFRELLKVFVLAAISLTLILSLGSILRPIQEYGVGPSQVLHLISYFMPITLTFVLPMAGLFAAALVYGRFANDNELDACRASGISLLTVIYPGFCLAIIVAIATLILSFYVVPVYVQRAEEAIKADARQILFRNIQRRGYYILPEGRYRIYADAANTEKNELLGVVMVDIKDNQIKRLITTDMASVRFEPQKKINEVTVIAHNAYQIDAEGEAFSKWLPVSGRFASLLSDDIKFKKIDDIKKIRSDLMYFYPFAKLAQEIYVRIASELLAQQISGKITDKEDRFYKLGNKEKLTSFTANQCNIRDDGKIELSGDVTLLEYEAATDKLLCTWRGNKAIIELVQAEQLWSLVVIVYNAYWQSTDGLSGLSLRHIIRDMLLPDSVRNNMGPDVMKTIGSTTSMLKKPTAILQYMQRQLQRKAVSTIAQIRAEIHSRLVFGIGCVTIILIGLALGIIFKGGHLLTAFGVSSVPAAALVVCIMMGRNLAKNLVAHDIYGITLMWVSLAALTVFAAVIYHKLLKA